MELRQSLDGGYLYDSEGSRFPSHRWRLGIRSTQLGLPLSRRPPSGQRPRGRMRTRSPIPGQRSSGVGSGPLSMSRPQLPHPPGVQAHLHAPVAVGDDRPLLGRSEPLRERVLARRVVPVHQALHGALPTG